MLASAGRYQERAMQHAFKMDLLDACGDKVLDQVGVCNVFSILQEMEMGHLRAEIAWRGVEVDIFCGRAHGPDQAHCGNAVVRAAQRSLGCDIDASLRICLEIGSCGPGLIAAVNQIGSDRHSRTRGQASGANGRGLVDQDGTGSGGEGLRTQYKRRGSKEQNNHSRADVHFRVL